MKTLVAKQIPGNERTWYEIDATGLTLGRLATRVATLISGRDRVDYTPHVDNGAYVVITNAEKIAVTGKKEEVKMYRTHSGYMGGLKETKLSTLREQNPGMIITHAVNGMLPKNRLRESMMDRLRVVAGPDHKYTAQKPQLITL